MTAPLTLYLVRHGEVSNPQHVLYGRLPNFHLSETGIQQANAAAQYLANVTLAAIFSSPMERAFETATLIGAANTRHPDIQVNDRLNEIYTPQEGKPLVELEKQQFDLLTGNQPPYEDGAAVRARLLAFVADCRARYGGQSVAAVTHGDCIVSLLGYACGKPAEDFGRYQLQTWGLPEVYPATGSILRLTFHTHDVDERPTFDYICPY